MWFIMCKGLVTDVEDIKAPLSLILLFIIFFII